MNLLFIIKQEGSCLSSGKDLIHRPILDQGFTYLGMEYTSASYTSAIMNAVPSVTFVIAVIFR